MKNSDYPAMEPTAVEIYKVMESTSRIFRGLLVSDGEPIAATSLSAFRLTMRQDYTHQIIGERDGQSILNENGGTVDEAGNFTWLIMPEDTQLLNRALEEEPHRCYLEWEHLSAGQIKRNAAEFILLVIRSGAK